MLFPKKLEEISDEPEKVINLFEQAQASLEQAREMAKERERRRLEAQDAAALPPPEDKEPD